MHENYVLYRLLGLPPSVAASLARSSASEDERHPEDVWAYPSAPRQMPSVRPQELISEQLGV